jgi:hypothetical protein
MAGKPVIQLVQWGDAPFWDPFATFSRHILPACMLEKMHTNHV